MVKVSVVVPSFNNAPFIAETVKSILDQSMQDFELILADHSSTDGTLDRIAEYRSDPRLTVLVTEPGGGAVRNWNRVSQAANSDYLKLVCGDDVLHRDALKVQLAALERQGDAVLAASRRRIVDANGGELLAARGLAGLTGVVPGHEAIRHLVRSGANIFGEPVCVLFRRASLDSAGWWDNRFPYLIDQSTYVRLLMTGSLMAIPEVLADFRLSDTQWSVALAKEQSTQARGLHEWVHEVMPEHVSTLDVRVGNARAGLTAAGRRGAYRLLSRRLRRRR